ncbi:hypothetical protein [Treponema pedis]|uniref:hypothetical protein n=1 Tax=Treponema pedis TaxID=409322 RepID=UPI001980B92C|nr:hypothetical protein [Treponema pedis]
MEKTDNYLIALDGIFEKVKKMQIESTVEKIEAMENSLDKLEEELTEIINLNLTETEKK